MTRFGWLLTLFVILLVMGLAVGTWALSKDVATIPVVEVAVPTATQDPTTLSLYSNGEYGFSLAYPSHSVVRDSLTLPTTVPWRIGAVATGTTIVIFTLPEDTEIRIGASSHKKEKTDCTKVGASEKSLRDVTVGSTTWTHTSFEKVGTDNEKKVQSYRTLHDDICVAFEIVMPKTVTLDSGPQNLESLITSFTFARP
jgi:hypothetical protein